MLKTYREEQIRYKATNIRLSIDVSTVIMDAIRQQNRALLKEENWEHRILYPANCYSKWGKTKMFSSTGSSHFE